VSERWRDKLPRPLQRAATLRLDKAEALKEMGSAAQPCFLAVLGVGHCAALRAPVGAPARVRRRVCRVRVCRAGAARASEAARWVSWQIGAAGRGG